MDASVAVASPRRRSSSSSRNASPSPEFEFWIAPQPQLHTADELFSDGLLLPLHVLRHRRPARSCPTAPCDAEPPLQPPPAPAVEEASIAASASCSPAWGSRRWRNLFKVGEKKERREDRKSGGAAKAGISIWSFYRSQSAGSPTTASGPRSWAAAYGARKSSSAPCSRSNSRGESSKSAATAAAGERRWAASPARAGGFSVGRSSPVWQIRPGTKGVEPAAWRRPDRRRSKATVGENLSVNSCIGYRGDGRKGVAGGDRNPFSLRTLVSKKVH